MTRTFSFIVVLLLGFTSTFATTPKDEKWAVNAKYLGWTYHPGGGSPERDRQYPLAVDDEAYIVLHIGAEADLDYYVNEYLILRATTAVFSDCYMYWSGHFHLGFRANYDFNDKFSFRVGIGPTLIWRENWWKKVSWYEGDGFYGKERTSGPLQSAFLWYGGNLEFQWNINETWKFVYSAIPGFPQVVTSAFGLRKNF